MATLEDYKKFMDEVCKLTDLPAMASDDDGLVCVTVEEDYILNLQFVAESEKILCFIEVAELPEDAPAAVYRDLLTGALFGRETGGGYFTMDGDTNAVVYNYLFDFATVSDSPQDFVDSLEMIFQTVEIWAVRIATGLSGESGVEAAAEKAEDVFIQP